MPSVLNTPDVYTEINIQNYKFYLVKVGLPEKHAFNAFNHSFGGSS